MALSADGKTLYLTHALNACQDELQEITLATGDVRVIDRARSAAVSPDGRHLAYVGGDPCGGGVQLVIRDPGTGAETRWEVSRIRGVGAPFLWQVSWPDDSRRLVYNLCDGDLCRLGLLDVGQGPGVVLEDGPFIGPADAYLQLLGFHAPSGGVAAWRACQAGQGARHCPEPPAIVTIEPDSGAVLTTLVPHGADVQERQRGRLRPVPHLHHFEGRGLQLERGRA